MLTTARRLPPGLVLFVGLNLANVSNYLYQVIMQRSLGPHTYGLLGSVVTLVNVATISLVSLQTATAKSIAISLEASGTVPRPLRRMVDDPLTRVTLLWGVVLSLVLLGVAPLIALFLHGKIGPATVVSAAIIPSVVLALGQGRLQGMHALRWLAVVAVSVAGLRLLLGPLAVGLGMGVTGAGMAVVLAAGIGGVWGLWLTRRAGGVSLISVRRDVGRGAIAFVAFFTMVSLDIPVAQHFLRSTVASEYAAASVYGKAVLWLTVAVAIALFPRIARDRSSGIPTGGILVRALLLTLGLGLVAVLGLLLIGPHAIPILSGVKFRASASLAWKVGLACLPFAIAQLLIYYHLAHDSFRPFMAIGAGAVTELAALAVLHSSPLSIALSMGLGGLVMCLGLLGLVYLEGRDPMRLPLSTTPDPPPNTSGGTRDIAVGPLLSPSQPEVTNVD